MRLRVRGWWVTARQILLSRAELAGEVERLRSELRAIVYTCRRSPGDLTCVSRIEQMAEAALRRSWGRSSRGR